MDIMYMYMNGWFMSMYDKNHYNIVISLQLIKNKWIKQNKTKQKKHNLPFKSLHH